VIQDQNRKDTTYQAVQKLSAEIKDLSKQSESISKEFGKAENNKKSEQEVKDLRKKVADI